MADYCRRPGEGFHTSGYSPEGLARKRKQEEIEKVAVIESKLPFKKWKLLKEAYFAGVIRQPSWIDTAVNFSKQIQEGYRSFLDNPEARYELEMRSLKGWPLDKMKGEIDAIILFLKNGATERSDASMPQGKLQMNEAEKLRSKLKEIKDVYS